MNVVDVVLIGRNEGDRLVAALSSVAGGARQVVYVDSGSSDGSVANARRAGAQVVELDTSTPVSAARARNAGFAALRDPDIVQFIDGDCMLVPGYLQAACARLEEEPALGLVTGWRSEIHPGASLYNRLCDWEWRRPEGPILTCGGDMTVRARAWQDIGGMNPTAISSEDEEFCLRLGKAGWLLERIPVEMTQHDAAMHRFGQWWSRMLRAGHGFAQVSAIHPEHSRPERRRALLYALLLPLLILSSAFLAPLVSGLLILAYPLNWYRTFQALRREGVQDAARLAALITLSKFPMLLGMAWYYLRRLRGHPVRIIEYK